MKKTDHNRAQIAYESFEVGDVLEILGGEYEVVDKGSYSTTKKWVALVDTDDEADTVAWRAENVAAACAAEIVDDLAEWAVGMAMDNAADMGLYNEHNDDHVAVHIEGYVDCAMDMAHDEYPHARAGLTHDYQDRVEHAAREYAREECGITTFVPWPGHDSARGRTPDDDEVIVEADVLEVLVDVVDDHLSSIDAEYRDSAVVDAADDAGDVLGR